MTLDERRQFPCPECGAEIEKLCVSKTGYRMARFVHPSRGKNEVSFSQLLRLRAWLSEYGDIFQEPA